MNRGRRCARALRPNLAVPVVHLFDFLHQVVAVCSLKGRALLLTLAVGRDGRGLNSVRSVMRALRVLIAVASVRGRGRVRARSR